MSKNTSSAALKQKSFAAMTTKSLAYCAMLAAIQVVLARLIVPMPAADVRFSIEAVPVFLAGMLFGPIAGALVGFSSDLVGCLFSGFGYNPLFCIPPILYGVCGGLFSAWLGKKVSLPRLLLAIAPAVVLGSILWQSFALTYVYFKDGPFIDGLVLRLGARSVQFLVTMVIDAVVLNLLFKSKIFERTGVWPRRKITREEK